MSIFQARTAHLMSALATFLACVLFFVPTAAADKPLLNFTDITNGPSVGIGDGLGSGAIVTIWGQHLGNSQSNSVVYFVDSANVTRPVAHHYYWKKADGRLPGGPANLSESHMMQEVAVSIPAAAAGKGALYAVVNGVKSNSLAFTVRAGIIYHVSARGNNQAPGSFAQPWKTVSVDTDGALKKNNAGDLIYTHGAVDAAFTPTRYNWTVGIYTNRSPGTEYNQTAIVSYPGTQSRIESYNFGFDVTRTKGFVLAKYKVLTGNHPEPSSSSSKALDSYSVSHGIQGTADGRVVGNYVGDLPGRCPSSQAGAIVANHNAGYDYVSNLKVYGNQIEAYGCPQSSRYHHTTYFTNRWSVTLRPYELAWNYLKDNDADSGLHNWDQTPNNGSACGNWNGPINIHNNVVVNQRGAAISFGTSSGYKPCWSNDANIYNNVLVGSGRGPNHMGATDPDINTSAIWLWGGAYSGTVNIYNNLIAGWGDQSIRKAGAQAALGLSGPGDGQRIVFTNNIVQMSTANTYWVNSKDETYGAALLNDVSGSNNLFYAPSVAQAEAIPHWSRYSGYRDPKILTIDSRYTVGSGSAAIGAGASNGLAYDIYGTARTGNDIGPFAAGLSVSSAPLPPSFSINSD